MITMIRWKGSGLALATLLALGASLRADSVTLAPAQDNTLYESVLGNLSNGKGFHVFAGLTGNGDVRRALLRFDLAAALPAGATITAVELRLYMSKTTVTLVKDVSLHRALAAWGEGASDAAEEEGAGAFAAPGDATWLNTFYPGEFWTAEGGDFDLAPSATVGVSLVGPYAWTSTPALVADVQAWLDQPELNHGWILIGAEGGGQSSKRFDSRENPDPAQWPALVLEYDPPAACEGEWMTYGSGLAGAGGLEPTLAGTGCPQIGDAITLEVADGVGGAIGALFGGLASASLPFKGGTFLVGDVLLQVNLTLGGAAGVPGAGSYSLPAVVPADPLLQGLEVYLQAGAQDAAATASVALSAGLRMTIG